MIHSGDIVLITGSSSGIGAACARYLAGKGLKVYGASRSTQDAYENFVPIEMDVTVDESVDHGIKRIIEAEGKLDVVINNAGIAYAGAVEDMSIEEARHQLEVNFFGCFRVVKAVLPVMRAREKGVVVTIGSIGGLIGLPFQAFYSASKFALEGLMEGLSLEVRRKGIRIVLVEPGDIKTSITKNRIISQGASGASAYNEGFQTYLDKVQRIETEARKPEVIAHLIYQFLQKKSPRLRYTAGTFSEKLGIWLRKWLPSRVFERIMALTYKL